MKDRTVEINGYNSEIDLNITFISVIKGEAEAKTLEVDVPYADGSVDMTEVFGEVHYKNRELSLLFHIPFGYDHWEIHSNVSNLFNGKRVRMILSADDQYYWEGRAAVGKFENDDGRWAFEMIVNAFPYKKRIAKTEITGLAQIDGTTINCRNEKMPTCPKFYVDGPTVIRFKDATYSATEAGIWEWDDIIFREGDNIITLQAAEYSTEFTVEYTEGSL